MSTNRINFEYKQRQRNEQYYVGGVSVKKDKILSAVFIYSDNNKQKQYLLEHLTTYLGYEKIKKVTEKNGLGGELNPTVFDYNETATATTFGGNNGYNIDRKIDNATHKSIAGDFDGDGKTDYLFYEKNTGNFGVYKNLQSGNIINIALTKDISSALLGNGTSAYFQGIIIDIFITKNLSNGTDGTSILNSFDIWTVVVKHERITYYLTYALENNIIVLKDTKKLDAGQATSSNQQFFPHYKEEFLTGDFNNDGQTDCITVHSQKNSLGMDDSLYGLRINEQRVYFKDLNKNVNTNFTSTLLLPYSNEPTSSGWSNTTSKTKDNSVLDFDGDGKSDFMLFDSSGIRIFTLNLTNNSIYEICFFPVLEMAEKKHFIGDFNGDGKSDIVVPSGYNEDNWTFFISTGTTFYKFAKPIGVNYNIYQEIVYDYEYCCAPPSTPHYVTKITKSLVTTNYIINDFDGDGKTDIMRQKEKIIDSDQINQDGTWVQDIYRRGSGAGSTNVIYNNSAIDISGIPSFSTLGYSNDSYYYGPEIQPGFYTIINDFKNSNKLFSSGYTFFVGKIIKTSKYNKNHQNEMLLKSITTGNGVKETITYKPLIESSSNSVYKAKKTNFEYYPNFDILNSSNIVLVSMLERQSSNTYKKKLFSYSEAVANIEGLGFLGFKKVAFTDWFAPGEQMLTNVLNNNVFFRCATMSNYKVLDYLPTDASFLTSSVINSQMIQYNQNPIQGNKVFKLSIDSNINKNLLNKTSVSILNNYDQYNNILSSDTKLLNNNVLEKRIINTFSYDNQPTASTYIIGRPLTKVENITAGSDVTSSEELFTYNNNLPTQIRKKGHLTSYLTQDNIFDSLGNITKKTITAVGETPRTINYEYSPTYGGRFLTKMIDVDGLATVYTYDQATGNVFTKLLPSNSGSPLLTSYYYDLWGKKSLTTNFLYKNQTINYKRVNEKTLITTSGEDGSESLELFDDLGRTIEKSTKLLGGNFSKISYEYDNHNRVVRTSEPYISSPSLWSVTQYDIYGRPTQVTSATGKTTSISYANLTTTTNDGTLTKETVKNASGNIISVTDSPGGNITYTYFANGNLNKTITSGATTTILQDGWGQKTSLNDPSAGLYTYQYNGFGEIKKETTPNGFTDYTYSSTGQMLTKWVKDAAIPLNTNIKSTYSYNPTTKLLETVTVVNPLDGNSNYTYLYDNYKRVIDTKEDFTTIDPRTFQKKFTFDDFGRPKEETTIATILGKSSTTKTLTTYQNGQPFQLLDVNSPDKLLWLAKAQNERGQNTIEYLGDNIITNTKFDNFGRPIKIDYDKNDNISIGTNNTILSLTNEFDDLRSNLIARKNSLFAWDEKFEYDSLDRLTTIYNQLGDFTQNYHDNGKISDNNLGEYNYTNTSKPFQNTSVTLNDDAFIYYNQNPLQSVSYTPFKSPITIQETGKDFLSFSYNVLEQRAIMYYGSTDTDKLLRPYRKYYSADGSVEIKYTLATATVPAKVEFFTYLGGDAYTAPIIVRKIDNGDNQKFYLLRDYLGSILAITNTKGDIIEKRLFDAWGGILKVEDRYSNPLPALTFFDRGYTGHEHLESVGLINMNGRLYDPKLHRFLQPDNNVQDPYNTQNYNRYGYVLNNPLKYNDPSGESWVDGLIYLGGLIASTYLHGVQASGEANPLKWDSSTWTNAALGGASNVVSNVVTNASNKYIENYENNKYIRNTKLENEYKGVSKETKPCVLCHFKNDGETFLQNGKSDFQQGAETTALGLVGAFSAGGAIAASDGAYAAMGGTLALTSSVTEVGIGIGQMLHSNDPKNYIHNANTLLGHAALQNNFAHPEYWDALGGFAPGMISGGNLQGVWDFTKLYKIQNSRNLFWESAKTYDAFQDTYGLWKARKD